MTRIPRRYHRIDGWRGYFIPGAAVAGASDTGTGPDGPCPTPSVKFEIIRLQCECLRPAGIKSRTRFGTSSNVFCGKRWVCVAPHDHARATELVNAWLAEHKHDTNFIHNAT